MKIKSDIIYVLIVVFLVIISAFLTKAVWESNLPIWMKFFILR